MSDFKKPNLTVYEGGREDHQTARFTTPALGVVMISDDDARVGMIHQLRCEMEKATGLGVEIVHRYSGETEEQIRACVDGLNKRENIVGITGVSTNTLLRDVLKKAINPQKDIEGATYFNRQRFFTDEQQKYSPIEPEAVIDLIPKTAEVVAIVGRGDEIGLPLKVFIERRGLKCISIETDPDRNPEWQMQLRCSGADTVVGACRYLPFGLEAKVLPPQLKHLLDVSICGEHNGQIYGNFDFDSRDVLRLQTAMRPQDIADNIRELFVKRVKELVPETEEVA